MARSYSQQTDPDIGTGVTIRNPRDGAPPTRIPGGTTQPGQLTSVDNSKGASYFPPRQPTGNTQSAGKVKPKGKAAKSKAAKAAAMDGLLAKGSRGVRRV